MASPPAIKRTRLTSLDALVSSRALPSLGKIFALTVGSDTIFVGTNSSIYMIGKSGFLAHVAGSQIGEMGYKDGRGVDARSYIHFTCV